MRPSGAITACAIAVSLGACAGPRALTPAQADAIETRPVDAGPDATFRAVAGVMLDRGMRITLSDRGAGLIGACTWGDPFAVPVELVAWVRPDSAGRSILRAQFTQTGIPAANADQVSRFAAEVGERTLMAAAPGRGP